MIAKPTLKTIPIAILLIIIVAGLGWMFGGGDDPAHPSKKTAQNNTGTRSEALPRKPAPRSKRNKLRPANIDVQNRLQTLYRKYPGLNIPAKNPDKGLAALYAQLFSEKTTELLRKEIEGIEQMIEGKIPWDEDAARQFLAKHKSLLDTLIKNALPGRHFQDPAGTESALTHVPEAIKLLTTTFALQIKLGDTAQAIESYQATQRILQSAQHDNFLLSTVSIVTQLQLGEFIASLESIPPEIAKMAIKSSFHSNWQIFLEQVLVGEFSANMKSAYHLAQVAPSGHYILPGENPTGSNQSGNLSLEKIEATLARSFLDRIQLLNTTSHLPPGEEHFDNFIKKLNSPAQNSHDSESQQILELTEMDLGSYYEAFKKTLFILQTQRVALQLGLAQSRNETTLVGWPRNYKTGEKIVLDKKNNQLLTGLPDKAATIKIPTISPPQK